MGPAEAGHYDAISAVIDAISAVIGDSGTDVAKPRASAGLTVLRVMS
jgi:hypothetical protein